MSVLREIAIDSFAGGGGTSEGIKAAIGRDPDIAVNHDRFALAMHRINHPGTHHLVEDVTEIDAIGMCAGRPVGMLWMSPDCFPAGTLILTDRGYRSIEEIEVGDIVLTHKLRWRKVTSTMKSRRPVMTISGHGHPGLRLSAEHPLLVRSRTNVWDNAARRYQRVLSVPQWRDAGKVDTDDYWGTPAAFEPLPIPPVPSIQNRTTTITASLMWLAGRYLADGWTRLDDKHSELVISCGPQKLDEFRGKIAEWEHDGSRSSGADVMKWQHRKTETVDQFTTGHKGLVVWLREQFGHLASGKFIPGWVLGADAEIRQSFLDGYLSGDGCVVQHKGQIVKCSTVSRSLAFGIRALAETLGHCTTVFIHKNSSAIQGREVDAKDIWSVAWRVEPVAGHAQTEVSDGVRWTPVKVIRQGTVEEDLFNLSVEEDETYVAEGIIVHNCKDHSKAKGGKPRDKNIRGLAWSCFGWVKKLPKWQRPRVVFLENVEEFRDWAPLTAEGKRCPIQKGAIFKEFVKAWEALGYVVEWRERRAWWSGAATIRKRLYMVMRCDGEPIVWPERTHGNPNDAADAALIAAGQLKPWRTAADIIDFSLPCPSIFDTSAEIKAKLGIRANRPLAENTMARVAKGTMRYVVNAVKPFVVKVNHTGRAEPRDRDIDAPLGTVTGKRDDALVTPFVTYAQQGGGNRDAENPLHTVTASVKDQNAIVTPFITKFVTRSTGHGIDEPVHTITAHASDTHGGGAAPMGLVASVLVGCGGRAAQTEPRPGDEPILTQTAKADLCVVAPVLTSYYGPGQGGTDRSASVESPLATDTAGGNRHGLVTPFLVPRYGERPGQEPRTRSVEEPAPVIVPTGNEGSLAAVHLSRQFGASIGSDAEEPVGTITAGGAGKAAVVAAFLAQHNSERDGGIKACQSVDQPISTVTATGGQQSLVAAHLSWAYTSNTRGGEGDLNKPAKTILAGGNHAATVYAFLSKYFGTGLPSQSVDEPLHTVSTKPRHGLVTVTVAGVLYAIVDIGMRMLTPRERFNAQGFHPNYIIDRGIMEDGTVVSFTLEQQGYMCGNSVCPSEAEALVAANYQPRERALPKRPAPMPMFLEAAE